MAELLPSAVLQFCDQNGLPYAGGTITFYEPGTSTLKSTWKDEAASAANTNPIVLDAAGRAIIFGDGAYRMVLEDVNGQLVWDQVTSTLVSAAMAPVVGAATLEDARQAMGITDAIQTETNRASGVEGNLQTQITNEATTRASEDANLSTAISAETTRATNAENNLQSQISGGAGATSVQSGSNTTDATGNASVAFGTAFTHACDSVVATANTTIGTWVIVQSVSPVGFTCRTLSPDAGGDWSQGLTPFYWMATGH